MSTKYASVSDDPLARAFNGIDSEDEGDEAENQLQPEPAGAARSVARRLGLMDDDSEDANGGAAESGDEQEEDTEMRHLSKAFSQLSSGDVTPMTRGPPNGRADAEQNPQEHARRLTRRLTRVSDAQNGLEARMKGIVSGEDVQVGGASASSSGTAVAVQLEDRALNSNARDMMSPVPPMSPPAPMTPIMAKRAGARAITPSRGPRTSDPVDAMTPVSRAHRAFGVQLERTGLLPDPPEIRGNAGTIEDTPQRTPAGRRSEIVDTPSRTPKRNRHSAGFMSRENSDDEVRGRNTRSGGPRAHRHSAPAKLPRMPFSSAEESDSDVDIVTRQGRDKWITKRSAARTRAMQHHRSAQFAAKQATKLARREVRREAKKQRQERELEEARKRADEEGLKFLREPTQIQKQQQENLEAVLAQIEEDEKTWQYAMLVAVGEKSRADDEEMKAHFMRYYMALRRDSIVWPTLQMALHVKRVDKVLQKVLAAYANVGIGAEVMPLLQKRAAVIRDVTKGIAAFKQLNWADIQILYGGQVPELVRTLLA